MKVMNNGGGFLCGLPCLSSISSPKNACGGRIAKLVYGIVVAIITGLVLATGMLIAGVGAAIALGAGGAVIALGVGSVTLWNYLKNKQTLKSQRALFISSRSSSSPSPSKADPRCYDEQLGCYYYVDQNGNRVAIDLLECRMGSEAFKQWEKEVAKRNVKCELEYMIRGC